MYHGHADYRAVLFFPLGEHFSVPQKLLWPQLSLLRVVLMSAVDWRGTKSFSRDTCEIGSSAGCWGGQNGIISHSSWGCCELFHCIIHKAGTVQGMAGGNVQLEVGRTCFMAQGLPWLLGICTALGRPCQCLDCIQVTFLGKGEK